MPRIILDRRPCLLEKFRDEADLLEQRLWGRPVPKAGTQADDSSPEQAVKTAG